MCGVFGFVSHDGKGPRDTTLAKIAAATERRGPHSWGIAWVDPRGRLRMYKQPGRITNSLNKLGRLTEGASLVIGHCRYATHGSPRDNDNNHPHPVDGGWFVHNGMVTNYRELAKRNDLELLTACDSEVLGHLIETGDGRTLTDRIHDAAAVQRGRMVFAGVWARPHRIVLARRDNPLHLTELDGRAYFASLPDSLPGRPYEVDNDTLLELRPGRAPEVWTITPEEPVREPVRPAGEHHSHSHGRLVVPGELDWTPARGRFNDAGCAVRYV